MGELGRRLSELTVFAISPDQRVCGELRSGKNINIWFQEDDDYYDYPDTGSLEVQLKSVIAALMEGYRNEERAVYEQFDGWKNDRKPHWDAKRRRFREEASQLYAEGDSPRRLVKIGTMGLHEWRVDIEGHAFDELDENQFCTEVKVALRRLFSDHRAELSRLKSEVYGQIGIRARKGLAAQTMQK